MEFVVLAVSLATFAALGHIARVWSTLFGFLLLAMLILGMIAYREHLNSFSFVCPIGAVLAFYFANRAAFRCLSKTHNRTKEV